MASVDIAFALRGTTLPRDHAHALLAALAQALDWFEDEPGAGVHAISGADAGGGRLYVSGRTKLVLRLPEARTRQALALTGSRLAVGHGLVVGEARIRPLAAHDTLYARLVATDCGEAREFERALAGELDGAGIRCGVVCGQRGAVAAKDGLVRGYSVLLHPLTPDASLLVQERGAGPARTLGCGLFLPHKSAAAVGA